VAGTISKSAALAEKHSGATIDKFSFTFQLKRPNIPEGSPPEPAAA
jgi:hypothetical protein